MFQNNYRAFMPTVTPVVKNIIIINVIMFLLTIIKEEFMIEKFALFYFGSPLFQPYQLVTHMFMHGGFTHIFFNMYTFYFFGVALERVWGSKKFLVYYFVTGLGAALLHNGVQYLEVLHYEAVGDFMSLKILNMIPTVGASGAIYGLLLAYGMLFPNDRIMLLIPPIPLKAKYFVIIFGGLELLLGLSNPGGSIAHFAHLGGMLFGLVLILYWKKNNRMYY